ncbi:hypothetical protein [Methylocapsa acidiphila]|uniref:hypothetical protein n=1 Tax=Methylocapsa acidiphila TaxID=133552 RepID=UPI0012EC4138|nr:hypothetical protein [Methylocapsa acidiphila]
MSENWGVLSFWVKLWAFLWLLAAQWAGKFGASLIGKLFSAFRNNPFFRAR